MKVKIITTIYADVPVSTTNLPAIVDSDTIGDYKAELDAFLQNSSCAWLTNNIEEDSEEIIIDSVEPYDEGIDEYGYYLEEWVEDYPELLEKLEEFYEKSEEF